MRARAVHYISEIVRQFPGRKRESQACVGELKGRVGLVQEQPDNYESGNPYEEQEKPTDWNDRRHLKSNSCEPCQRLRRNCGEETHVRW
jgi:hypothetical protein